MNKIIKLFSLFIGIGMLLTSCQKSIGLQSLPSTATFKVTQLTNIDPGGNTVVLENTTPNSVGVFDYGLGTTTKVVDTIHFAFTGKYPIKFTAYLQGGSVQGITDTVVVTSDNLNYVNDPLWTALCGGVGQSKEWIFDNGNYGLTAGAMSYADPSIDQEFENYTINWDPGMSSLTVSDADMQDTMTFDLIGGPHLTVYKPNEPGASTSGTYFLDVNTHTLTTTNVSIIRLAAYINNATNWTNSIKILELNDNQLRIAIMRTNSEGAWWYVFNYVSKDYALNYKPAAPKLDDGFNPTLTQDQILSMLAGDAGQARRWKLDGGGNPVDWIDGGIGWTTDASSSYNWGWDDAWTAAASSSWIQFDRINGDLHYIINQQGTISKGTYSVDAKTNEVTLSPATLSLIVSGEGSWMDPTTNVLKIVKAWSNDYNTKGIWFGTSYTANKDEWLAFHYIVAQ